jgi:hypothetical protein
MGSKLSFGSGIPPYQNHNQMAAPPLSQLQYALHHRSPHPETKIHTKLISLHYAILELNLDLVRLKTSFLGVGLRFRKRVCWPLISLVIIIIDMQFHGGDWKPFRLLIGKLFSKETKYLELVKS